MEKCNKKWKKRHVHEFNRQTSSNLKFYLLAYCKLWKYTSYKYEKLFEGISRNFLTTSKDVIFEKNKIFKRTIMADGTCSRQRLPLLFKPSDPPFTSPFPGDRLSLDNQERKFRIERVAVREKTSDLRRNYPSISHIKKVSISRKFDVFATRHIHIHIDKIYTHINMSLRYLHRAATPLRGSILLKRGTNSFLRASHRREHPWRIEEHLLTNSRATETPFIRGCTRGTDRFIMPFTIGDPGRGVVHFLRKRDPSIVP